MVYTPEYMHLVAHVCSVPQYVPLFAQYVQLNNIPLHNRYVLLVVNHVPLLAQYVNFVAQCVHFIAQYVHFVAQYVHFLHNVFIVLQSNKQV